MALWDQVKYALAIAPQDHPPLQTRAVATLEDFRLRMTGNRDVQWRLWSTAEALSVPAIFRAVTLISNVVGSLSLRAYRDGVELNEDQRPQLLKRGNPLVIPREFSRETAWSMAVYGEAWWWVANRDADDKALSLIPANPREVTVDDNPADPRFPKIIWRGRERPNRDMIQIKMTGEPGQLRGKGPLQMCGAAVSVSVEAQEWAANYFKEDGGIPSIVIKTAAQMSAPEAEAFLDQWMSKAHNVPRVIDPGVDSVESFEGNQQGAQMLSAREFQTGEAARMFGIPGTLLDHAVPGSSLTYQNVGQEFDKFVRSCLLPDYLEPIEQTISDLLPRAVTARFNTEALLRADVKTQYDVATLGFEKGLISETEGRRIIGYGPSIENAAVPFSPPQAFPTPSQLQARSVGREVRCSGCSKLLIELAAPPYRATCSRCKTVTEAAA